jgi:two-component system nitrogen regulation response regulator GlnG
MATVLVVDSSASVRETLRIVLASEHDVRVQPSFDARAEDDRPPDVLVVGLDPGPRDDRALGEAVARAMPGVPILVLSSARDVDLASLAPPHVAAELMPKPFDAYAVRARVRSLARAAGAAPPADDALATARRHLGFPFLPRAAAEAVRAVLAADLPVVGVRGEVGTGARPLARAVHVARRRRGPFVTLEAPRLVAGGLERRLAAAGGAAGGTVYLGAVDGADPEVQTEILDLVDDAIRARRVDVVAATAGADLAECAARGAFLPELAYALTTVPLVLTPLRERIDDLPALVESTTQALCARLRLEPVRYTPEALERLRHYLWFGNVAELEAVLARTLVLGRPTTVDAGDLLFMPADAPAVLRVATGAEPVAAAAPTVGDGQSALDLEVVLGELAHELRNPMVTIKTFAQHLDSVLADPETRARFVALTTEAIGRMDGLLETLLDYARFGTPIRRHVDVANLLDRALAEQADELERRHVAVTRNGTGGGAVEADEAQVLFALRSLCRGLVPDLMPQSVVAVRGAERGFEMQVRTEASVAARLAAWVDSEGAHAADAPPLMWALAASLLARNGGRLAVARGDGDATVIRVEWRPTPA